MQAVHKPAHNSRAMHCTIAETSDTDAFLGFREKAILNIRQTAFHEQPRSNFQYF